MDRKKISKVRSVISKVRKMISKDRRLISNDRKTISMDRKVIYKVRRLMVEAKKLKTCHPESIKASWVTGIESTHVCSLLLTMDYVIRCAR